MNQKTLNLFSGRLRERERERERVEAAAKIFSYKNLLKCYYDCRKRKRYTVNAAKFELHFETELLKLQKELVSNAYKPGQSICFVVTKPKPREIFAADFRDRIVHHVLVDYLEPIWEPKLIGQSYSCRKGKGTHQAIKDLKRYIRKISYGGERQSYYLQIDICSFFVSLNKNILFEILKKHTKNPEILWLTETLIFHDPTTNYYRKSQMSLFDIIPDHKSLFKVGKEQGLPIGNLTSQFFANVYLNELDQFVKHSLKVKYYQRYVDDMVILSENTDQLKAWQIKIDRFLKEALKLELHPQKQILRAVDEGIDFVGYVVKPDYALIRRRVVGNFREKLRLINQNKDELDEDGLAPAISVVNSYYGQMRHANTFGLRKKLWLKDFGKLHAVLKPADANLGSFSAKKNKGNRCLTEAEYYEIASRPSVMPSVHR